MCHNSTVAETWSAAAPMCRGFWSWLGAVIYPWILHHYKKPIIQVYLVTTGIW